TYNRCSERMPCSDIISSSVKDSDNIGVRTASYERRTLSPSTPTTYSRLRHQRRHCAITPRGRSPTLRSRLPGKYPTTRSANGTTTNQSHHTNRRVCQLFSSQ